jgi:hypothetical protein
MGAIPKKKLCWNCEGNVSKEVDNCPYCGVYIHSFDIEEHSNWNPSYHSESPKGAITAFQQTPPDRDEESDEEEKQTASDTLQLNLTWPQLKQDVLSMVLLMMGSIFFLFGIVLLLFSQNGTLTLQWQEKYGWYFLFSALPLVLIGWKWLKQLELNE